MKFLRRISPFVIALLALMVFWVLWNRPKKVDMAGYVPADSLVYLEANSLPGISGGLTSTEAWKALAPAAGIRAGLGNIGWLTHIAGWTGIGPADAVVFSRAQVAATVVGIDTVDGDETLRVRPRLAVIVETHTGSRRARAVIEKHVGNFARRAYGEPRIEHKAIDDTQWTIWLAPKGDRQIILAMMDGIAFIGNDEAAVRACLAVKRGERPSLAGNVEMEEMRRRVTAGSALAFGYISAQGAVKLFEVAAALYVSQISQEPQTQSLAASILPQIARKILGSLGWSARVTGGLVEDTYFMASKNDASVRLRDALSPASASTVGAGQFLPSDTYSVTRYSTRDPLAAWRGLNISIATQLDPVLAVMVPPFLKAALRPYGLEEPELFFKMIGSEITTARLDDKGESTVIILETRDENSLRELVFSRLGTKKPGVERIGDAELLSGADPERGAASFVSGHLLMGAKQNLRKCLEAREHGQILSAAHNFQYAALTAQEIGPAHAVTFTRDTAPARTFISLIASQRSTRAREPNEQELTNALGRLPLAVSETQLIEGGFERKTRSSFGQFGTLAAQFSTSN